MSVCKGFFQPSALRTETSGTKARFFWFWWWWWWWMGKSIETQEREGWGWRERVLASLLPPCSLLHCTAAVSAGMAPLTICSLIANIRVHFLRQWTGTERWRAVLWAFLSLRLSLSLSLPFSLRLYSLRCCCKDTLTHIHTHNHHTHLTGGRWVIRLIYTISLCPAVHQSQSSSSTMK